MELDLTPETSDLGLGSSLMNTYYTSVFFFSPVNLEKVAVNNFDKNVPVNRKKCP